MPRAFDTPANFRMPRELRDALDQTGAKADTRVVDDAAPTADFVDPWKPRQDLACAAIWAFLNAPEAERAATVKAYWAWHESDAPATP